MISWVNYLRNQGTAVKTAVLVIAATLAFLAAAPVAFHLGGGTALAAAVLAAVLCLGGASIALLASRLLREPQHALAALVIGMAMRMGIPLAFGVTTHLQGGPLAEAGLLYYLLIFYPVTLTVETALSLPPSRPPVVPTPASSNSTP